MTLDEELRPEEVEEPVFDPATAQTASTRGEALALALAWADGRRSWVNLGRGDEVTAVMDAQEVVKWTAMAGVLPWVAAEEAPAPKLRLTTDGPAHRGSGWLLVCEGFQLGWEWPLPAGYADAAEERGRVEWAQHVERDHPGHADFLLMVDYGMEGWKIERFPDLRSVLAAKHRQWNFGETPPVVARVVRTTEVEGV